MVWSAEELSYCTNVHPGESLRDVISNLNRFVGPVKEHGQTNALGAGLWISHQASCDLELYDDNRTLLKRSLQSNNLVLNSLNGFPYGNFHQDVIKQEVYLPDWSESSRLDYTVTLAEILADCLSNVITVGTISTLPLGFRAGWTLQKHQASLSNLCKLSEKLASIERETGKHIRVCLEMEPACVIEKTPEMVAFFTSDLVRFAKENEQDRVQLFRYLGVCYDVCHQAVMFEDIRSSLNMLHTAGITIGKIQLSSALKLDNCSATKAFCCLSSFAEPRYLHQTSVRSYEGSIRHYTDLQQALDEASDSPGQEWRVHYHVPLQLGSIASSELSTTQFALDDVFEFLASNPELKPHLEVETYTWNVLPDALRPQDDESLIRGIDSELQFVRQKLTHYQLLDQETNVSEQQANARRTD